MGNEGNVHKKVSGVWQGDGEDTHTGAVESDELSEQRKERHSIVK